MLSVQMAIAFAGTPIAATAHSPAGTVAGAVERDIAVYLGVPYAKPPVGALRWHRKRASERFNPMSAVRRRYHAVK